MDPEPTPPPTWPRRPAGFWQDSGADGTLAGGANVLGDAPLLAADGGRPTSSCWRRTSWVSSRSRSSEWFGPQVPHPGLVSWFSPSPVRHCAPRLPTVALVLCPDTMSRLGTLRHLCLYQRPPPHSFWKQVGYKQNVDQVLAGSSSVTATSRRLAASPPTAAGWESRSGVVTADSHGQAPT